MSNRFWQPNFPFSPSKCPWHYGWAVAFLGALGTIASMPGQTIGVNVFNEALIVDLGLSRTQVSAAYLVGTLASGLVLPFAGSLYDRFGARRLIFYSSLGLGVSLFYIAHSDRFAGQFTGLWSGARSSVEATLVFLTIGFFLIRFWGQGMITMTSRNMVGKWWEGHRGKVYSISGIVVSVGFSTTPLLFNALIEGFGWREAWVILGVALLLFSGLAWLGFRDNPGECGLGVDAGMKPQGRDPEDSEFRIKKEFNRREALSTYSFWLFSLVFALQGFYFTGYSFHVVSVGGDVGLSKEAILKLFIPPAFVGAGVSLFVGWASDRWRLKYLIGFMSFGMSCAPIGFLTRDPQLMPVFIILGFGISSGCFGTISGTYLPRFFGLKHLGSISGFFMSLLVIASSMGPFFFSLTLDMAGTYDPAQWTMLVLALALGVGAFWADNPQRKL